MSKHLTAVERGRVHVHYEFDTHLAEYQGKATQAYRFIVNRSLDPHASDAAGWICTCQRGSVYWWVGTNHLLANMRTFPAVVDDFGNLVEVQR